MATTIPVVTKEEIWAYKELSYIYNERYPNLDGVTTAAQEAALDAQVTLWHTTCQGYVKARTLETYYQYITTETWIEMITQYCRWKAVDMNYSTEEQALTASSYLILTDTIIAFNTNVTAQAELNVIPNHHSNMQFFNES